jgi:hypothetical protein
MRMKNEQATQRFHSLRELAVVIGKAYRTIHRAARQGKIRTKRFGGSVLIDPEEWERILRHGWK